MEFHIKVFGPFMNLEISRECNGTLIVGHDVGNRWSIQMHFSQTIAEPLEMQNFIVLPNVFGMGR